MDHQTRPDQPWRDPEDLAPATSARGGRRGDRGPNIQAPSSPSVLLARRV